MRRGPVRVLARMVGAASARHPVPLGDVGVAVRSPRPRAEASTAADRDRRGPVARIGRRMLISGAGHLGTLKRLSLKKYRPLRTSCAPRGVPRTSSSSTGSARGRAGPRWRAHPVDELRWPFERSRATNSAAAAQGWRVGCLVGARNTADSGLRQTCSSSGGRSLLADGPQRSSKRATPQLPPRPAITALAVLEVSSCEVDELEVDAERGE